MNRRFSSTLVALIVVVLGIGCKDNKPTAPSVIHVAPPKASHIAQSAEDIALEKKYQAEQLAYEKKRKLEEQSKAKALAPFEREFRSLQATWPTQKGVLIQAQNAELCAAKARFAAYQNLDERLDRASKKFGFLYVGDLDEEVRFSEDQVRQLTYSYLKEGKLIGCGGSETDAVKSFAKVADSDFGYFGLGEKVDIYVIRKAYLRAVKSELALYIGSAPEDPDMITKIAAALKDAKVTWNFTLDELGVPPLIAKRFGY